MKIIYFIDRLDTPGGMERVLTVKANYLLEKYNYDVQVVVKNSDIYKPFFDLNNKIKIHYLDLKNASPSEHKVKVEKILFKEKPDFSITLMGNEVYFLHSIEDGSKKIAEFHNSKQSYLIQAEENNFQFLKKLYRIYLVHKLGTHAKKYDKFVNLTYEDQKDWGNFNNSIVIQNPITFKIDNRLPNYKAKSVLSVGRISFQKGFEYLIEVWKKVYEIYPDWKLIILGRRDDSDNLDELIRKESLENVIEVLPANPNVRDYYYDSSIYIASSRYEGFPMTLLEAASCGLPIVSWKCPTGPAEIVLDGEDGLLAEYKNCNDLADKLLKLMNDKSKREHFGKKAKENINRFSLEEIMGKWQKLFKSLNHE